MKSFVFCAVLVFFAGQSRLPAAPSEPGYHQKIESVRTTAYTSGASCNGEWSGRNAIGTRLKSGPLRSAAADWSHYPLGTRFRVLETGQEYVIDDYGSALIGTGTIDLFKPSAREMNRWGVRRVTLEILEWGSPEKSLRILSQRKGLRHVREMVERLRQQDAV